MTRPRVPGTPDRHPDDGVLRLAALFFAAGLALHTADHLRRGTGVLTTEVLWGGMLVTVAGVVAIAAVLARHRLAPQVAAAVGLPTAVGVSASHLLPRWSSFSDAFPGREVEVLSWAAVSVEVVGAILLAAAGMYALRHGRQLGGRAGQRG